MSSNIDEKTRKVNKRFKISLIIFIIVAIITALLVYGKGSIFGVKVVHVYSGAEDETHTISIVADSYYLIPDGDEDDDETTVYVTIDGKDVTEGYGLISSDEEVLKIDVNKIKAGKLGTATITAVDETNGSQAQITINVVKTITKFTLYSEYKQITIGEQNQMSYTFKPSSASVNVKYSSSDDSIATVDQNGIVTGVSEGTVTITATDEISGKTDSCKIKVK